MPEDQETVTPRRRSRRPAPTQQAESIAAEAQGPVAADNLAAQAPSTAVPPASAPRRRTRRIAAGDTAGGVTEDTAAANAPAFASDGQPAATPARRHRASRATSEPSAGGEQSVTDEGTPSSESKPRRASGPRVGRRRTNAGAEGPAASEQSAAQQTAVPAAESATARQPDAAAEAAPAPGSGAPVGRPYRFGHAGRGRPIEEPAESQAAPAAEAPAEQPTAEPPHGVPSEPAAEMTEPGPDGILRRTASDVGIRPLRRRWSNQEGRGREGIAPHIPCGQRGGQPQYPPAQGRAGGQQQPGRGPVPYSPGGRGQPAPSGQPPYAPGPNGGQGQNGTGTGQPPTQAGQPYGPYNPYEPYPNAYPGPAGAAGDGPAQGGRRGRFGRYNEPRPTRGAPPAPGRGPRQDLYREQGAPGRGMPSRGGVHPPHDRRFGGRGYGRGPREQREYGRGYGPGAATAEAPYQLTPRPGAPTVEVSGLVWLGGGAGLSPAELLDGRTLQPIARINPEEARRLALRSGDELTGRAEERGVRKLLVAVETVNGQPVEEAKLHERPVFEQLTASFPDRRIRLEQAPLPVSARIIDLFAPLGFGSRALIVAPPKTGKTTLIREAAESVLKGYPDAVVMAVLVGERPEEVTDLRARLEPRGGLVFAASFDEDTQRHAWLVQVAVERAKRVAEAGKDAFMVLDSLTRLARAENLASRGAGRTLSGGIDAQALDTGRRAFGAARNLEEGGSLTILATCLVDTGSRQDDVVYEEFKGTGNMELHLSRELSQRRLFPAIDAVKSGTRREEMLLTPEELKAATMLRRRLADLPPTQAIQQLLGVMEKTPSNAALISAIEASGWGTTVR